LQSLKIFKKFIMAKELKFTKMHGAGNDYIYVDTTRTELANPEARAIEWSRFHTGIGSDGLILVGRSDVADFSMRIFNADGSEAMMCGNGCRCVGKFVYDKHLTDKTDLTLETKSGVKTLHLNVDGGEVKSVTVGMGSPLEISEVDLSAQLGRKSTFVSMGNPHLITEVDNIANIDLPQVGPKIECHPMFPDRTNVEFAQIIDCKTIRMRVWERGSGITQACGTGACATAVAAISAGKVERTCDVIMDGGTVTISWDAVTGEVKMTGPATTVFEGTIVL
jgi:diaminopimelate epimerase